jgi:hypothetical protein
MPSKRKHQIIAALQKMDESLLEVSLDNDRTYQEASKSTFIQKLSPLFEEIKASGDTYLKVYSGECKSTECHTGCNGFSFVGEKSGKYIDLIFMEKEGEVSDIFHCSDLGTEEIVMDRKERLNFIVNLDEHADFKPGLDFVLTQKECRRALAEIKSFQDQVLQKPFHKKWLSDYRYAYKFFSRPPLFYTDFNEFHSIYWKLEELYNYSLLEPIAKNALSSYHQINHSNEQDLINWLSKYENFGMKLILFDYLMGLDEQQNLHYLEVLEFKVDAKDYENVMAFRKVFDYEHTKMRKKNKLPVKKIMEDGE